MSVVEDVLFLQGIADKGNHLAPFDFPIAIDLETLLSPEETSEESSSCMLGLLGHQPSLTYASISSVVRPLKLDVFGSFVEMWRRSSSLKWEEGSLPPLEFCIDDLYGVNISF